MICPECETEYRPGVLTCADCGVDLVEELQTRPSARLVNLVVTHDGTLVSALTDTLEKAGVPYVVEAGTALPMLDDQLVEEPEPWSARVWVLDTLESRAREILVRIRSGEDQEPRTSRPFPGVE